MRMIYALRMWGTDIISCLRSKYIVGRKPYILLRQQYFIHEAEPPPCLRRGLVILVDVIGIGLAEQCDAVDQPADAKEAAGKEVQDAHTNFTLIELVGTKCTQEETEQECDPLVLGAECDNGAIVVGIGIGVRIVDYDVGLFSVLQLLHLATAVRAEHGSSVDLLSAVLTELGVWLYGVGGDGIFVHNISLLI